MDSVRFGKALGTGAREAAKALINAADAASTPTPNRPQPKAAPAAARPTPPRAAQAAQSATETARNVREGSRRFGEAVWKPAVKVTGIVWLEVMGVFFSLFVFVGAGYCWSHRTALQHGTPEDQRGFWTMAAVTLLFSYFCLSSFIRAKRRARK